MNGLRHGREEPRQMSQWPKPVGRCEKQPRGWKKRRGREMGSKDGKKEALLLKILQMLFRNLKGTYWHLE